MAATAAAAAEFDVVAVDYYTDIVVLGNRDTVEAQEILH